MSSDKKKRILLIFEIFSFVFLSGTQFTGAPAKPQSLTAEQREEIEKLRAELSNAFDEYEDKKYAEQGVVVQPGWTKGSEADLNVNSKVVVTEQGLDEVEALRAEINKAIEEGVFVDDSTADDFPPELGLRDKSKDVFTSMLGSTTEDKSNRSQIESQNAGTSSDDSDDESDEQQKPNVVDASSSFESDIDIRKLQRLELSKRREKEVLVLKFIVEDLNFNLGEDVQQWKHIMHDGEEYFIGRRHTDLFIVHKNGLKYNPVKYLTVGQPISYLETYSFWNIAQQQQEGVALVASQDKVLWYRVDKATQIVGLYWEWVVGTTISGLTYFSAQSNDYLAVSSNQSSRTGYYALNIYQFDLDNREFWIAQRMQLQNPCKEVTIHDTGRDIILAVAQHNTAAIYTFNPHADAADYIRFRLRRTYQSEGIELINAFQMGGRSYLALGGLQPQILLYQQGDFVPKTILGNNFGLVELFFPVPTRTYRDDLLLLVQHRVDFGTHSVTVLETLVWDGEAFVASVPAPCQLGNHTLYGVSCMLDIQRDEGLKGAALVRREKEIAMLVPRQKAESGLFLFNVELLAKNSELLDLQDIFSFLQDWVKEQDELIAQARSFLSTADTTVSLVDFSNLDVLDTPELYFNGDVDEIYVNDYKWTEDDTNADLAVLMNAIEELETDLSSGRHKREINTKSLDILEYEAVQVEDLLFEQLNNEKFYIQAGALDFPGVLNLNSLQVLENAYTRESRQAVQQLVEIHGDLEFAEINGVPWAAIRDNLVFRNAPLELTKLDVKGEVIVEDRLSLEMLNSLNFPGDYLWSSGPATSTIQGEKTFIGTLAANAVDTDGFINKVNPLDAITLSEPQDWTGFPTFANLEVSEKLELNGTAHGRGFEGFPSNPTLQEEHIISAACEFAHLEVLGSIYLNGQYDNIQLAPMLSDVVLRPADANQEIVINSKKTIDFVAFPIDFWVGDNGVSGVGLDTFVTAHTKQTLDLSSVPGYIYFNNLSLSGVYDGVNIEELHKNAIKIDTVQLSPGTQLNFVDIIRANELNVVTSLNGVPLVAGYQTVKQDLALPTAHFEHLKARTADVLKGITGNSLLNGMDLHAFLKQRNWTAAADTGNLFVDELNLKEGLESDRLHGIDADFLLEFLQQIDDLPEMILDGKIQVDHVIVSGDVQLNKLHGHSFDEDVQMTAIWLNRPNYLSTSLQFVEPPQLHGDLVVLGDFNAQNFPDLIDDMVFRPHEANTPLLILAPKSFSQNVNVKGNTLLDAIAGVPFTAIATKQTIDSFKGKLEIHGNLIVHELEVAGSFNEYAMSDLSSLLRYDRHLGVFVLLGDTVLPAQMQLQDLTVYGSLNEITELQNLFENLVYKSKICLLKGTNVFTGRVSIRRGAYVRRLNDHNLLSLLQNVVYIGEPTAVLIKSPVDFAHALSAREVVIEGSLATSNLSGCSLQEWLTDTLRVDRQENITNQLNFVRGSLDGNCIRVDKLNDIDLSKIVTLYTPQNLSDSLHFSELFLDGRLITSNGSVNGVDLKEAYENTLLTRGNQHVSTPLTLQSIYVLQDLNTNAPVNSDKELRQVATLHSNVHFESPLFFQNVSARNVLTNDLVSGINLVQWFNSTLWLAERAEQRITGNWSVNNLNVKSGPAMPSFIGDDVSGFDGFMRTPRDDTSYKGLSQKIRVLIERQQKRACFVKHLEESFSLNVSEQVDSAFVLQQGQHSYLLLNANCTSVIYKWNSTQARYVKLQSFISGPIAEVKLLPQRNATEETLKFVTNFESTEPQKCTLQGLNTWRYAAYTIEQLHNYATKASGIKVASSKLYVVVANAVQQISLEDNNHINTWHLPDTPVNVSYRFVPAVPSEEVSSTNIMLSNGRHIILLRNGTEKRERDGKFMPTLNNQDLEPPTSLSILKPNLATARKLTFADFKQVVERILLDLIYRLHLEVNITQLSIPESDLYDEHLVADFLAIMEELQKQQIFPPDTFADIKLQALQIPGNPAQALAARTVQIIWPVIVEIEEVHGYLRDNVTHEHPVCGCLMASLGGAVKDVLLLANGGGQTNVTDEHNSALMAVIERIRKFQRYLKDFAHTLNTEIKQELQGHLEAAPLTDVIFESNSNNAESSFGYLENMLLPAHKADDILNLQVGPTSDPRTLVVLATMQSQLVAGQQTGIYLYMGAPTGRLYQSIDAHQPRSIVSLRIRDESLLAFVEDCCTVQLLIYRGVRGFVDLAQFKSDAEIIKLLGLSVLNAAGKEIHFLAVVQRNKVVFYEVVVAGPGAK